MKRFQKLFSTSLVFLMVLFVLLPHSGVVLASGDYIEAVEEGIDKASTNVMEGDVDSEWEAIGLVQAGKEVPKAYAPIFKQNVQGQIINGLDNGRIKITDIERLAMAAVAIGKDPRNIDGLNLIEHIYNSPERNGGYDTMTFQGNNGPIFALIALDSINFDVPEDAKWTREKLVDELLHTQNEDGSWDLNDSFDSPSIDITAMALIGLSPYKDQPLVKEALDKTVAWLSLVQKDNGGFDGGGFVGGITSEAASQVIIGLTAYGISPTDERFTKDENDLIGHLLGYQNKDGGFKHTHNYPDSNAMATEQALQALVAYKMFMKGEGSLYDFKNNHTPEPPVDNIAPDITVKGISDGETVLTSEVTFNVHVNDNIDGKVVPSVKVNDTVVSPNEDGTYTANLNKGDNSIAIFAEDQAGNSAKKSYQVVYQVENHIDIGDGYQDVNAKETLVIENTKVVLPDDLPEGTKMKVTNYDTDKEKPEGIKIAGDVFTFDFEYPEGTKEPNNFQLTMGINKKLDTSKIAIYHFNEDSEQWEFIGGEVKNGVITANVDHFSTYGVFADTEVPSDVQLNVKATTSDSITLEFSAKDLSGIKEYAIYRDDEKIATLDGGETDYVDKKLEAGKTYEYELVATDQLDNTSTVIITADTHNPEETPELENKETATSKNEGGSGDDSDNGKTNTTRNMEEQSDESGNAINEEASNKLPETSTNTFNFLLIGAGLIVAGLVVMAFYIRKRRWAISNYHANH